MNPTQQKEDVAKRVVAAIREMWKNTTPKIDLIKQKETIDPNDYTITLSKFNAICEEYKVKIGDSLYLFVNKTPKIIDG